ncbi:MAG: hypothetical protein KF723_03960 [Rhizobiaceae bacterium]|nr:hypothetical protein [Rhizobiaceae bacterium]
MTRSSDFPPSFRHVKLLLAREKENPSGQAGTGYDLLVPLDRQGRIELSEWKAHQLLCRVRRFATGDEDQVGRLRRKPGGQWYFDYAAGESDDDIAFRFDDERFVPGEYVSLAHGGRSHTYQVARVEKP